MKCSVSHGTFPCTCGQLAAGTCEIVTLDRDSSQPRRTIARQTARCACKKGQIAGTTRARPACVDARIIKTKQWCEMLPCLEGEGCDLLINKSGWTCTQPGGRIKTTTKSEHHRTPCQNSTETRGIGDLAKEFRSKMLHNTQGSASDTQRHTGLLTKAAAKNPRVSGLGSV
ncbi:chemokine-like protein TAFA-5 isoform X2 [Carettochelys insculpta]|uniref:chemokine-like protein TAFA-5 isoform X2 n=1 Tax=Carettochelys insculpta TaxID=44489 RepID=UPI003EB7BBDE